MEAMAEWKDLSTTVEDGRPHNLLLCSHIAFAIERELRRATG